MHLSVPRLIFVLFATLLFAISALMGQGLNSPSDAPRSALEQKEPTATEMARFLAGIAQADGKCPIAIRDEEHWRLFAKEMSAAWQEYQNRRLEKIQQWAADELAPLAGHPESLFYPFGGPDALHAITLFPASRYYILVGLERPGSVPVLGSFTDEDYQQLYGDIRRSLQSILRTSFFKTLEMDSDLRVGKLKGTLPLVLLFLARADCQVQGIRYVTINAEGQLIDDPALPGKRPIGFELAFRNSRGLHQMLVYLSVNLQDDRLQGNQDFLRYVERAAPFATFMKSAAYLMHMAEFSTIRQIVLTRSKTILQDDSGIPYRYYSPKEWSVTLFGTYQKPIATFATFAQQDLLKAYVEGNAKPLNISMGYGKVGNSNLLFARRQLSAASANEQRP